MEQRGDLSSLAGRGVFASLLVPGVFEQARLSDAGVPEWPRDLDLCADSLYLELTGKVFDSKSCEALEAVWVSGA